MVSLKLMNWRIAKRNPASPEYVASSSSEVPLARSLLVVSGIKALAFRNGRLPRHQISITP
jgi:hypothetical protein